MARRGDQGGDPWGGGDGGLPPEIEKIFKKMTSGFKGGRFNILIIVAAVILAHNHPSDNLRPSKADIEITKKIKEAGKFLDIAVLDHIIVAGNSFTSLADEGLM